MRFGVTKSMSARDRKQFCVHTDNLFVTSQQNLDNNFSVNPSIDSVLVKFKYAPHNDVSVNDGRHIRRWSHNIIIYYYTIVIHLPTVFSTVTRCTGL